VPETAESVLILPPDFQRESATLRPDEVAEVKPAAPTTMMQVLLRAVESGVDVGTLERLSAMVERENQRQAEDEFGRALANFQAQCPVVEKTRIVYNKGGKDERYRYANLEDCVTTAKPHLAANKIAFNFSLPKIESGVCTIICYLTVGRITKEYPYIKAMPDMEKLAASMYMTVPQADGFVMSYYKRQSFLAATGMVVGDEDNDACANESDKLEEKQIERINTLIDERETLGEKTDLLVLCKMAGGEECENLADVPKTGFGLIVYQLETKIKLLKKAKEEKKG
jgi:hypothetical protein